MSQAGKEPFPKLSNGSIKHACEFRKKQVTAWLSGIVAKTSDQIHEAKNVKFESGSVFRSVCMESDLAEINHFLDQGCDIDAANEGGLTALHFACLENNLEVVKLLVKRGANINAIDVGFWTPLHLALCCTNYEIARYLIENGANLDALTIDNALPIDLVPTDDSKQCHLNFIKYLDDEMCRRNLDASALRQKEENELLNDLRHLLAQKHNVATLVKRLTDERTGASPLHVAAAKDYFIVLNQLLELGADPNVKDLDNWTPLHASAHWGIMNTCLLLIESGCDTQALDLNMCTPLDVADPEISDELNDLIDRQSELIEEAKKMTTAEKLHRLHVVQRRARHQSLKRTDADTPRSASPPHLIQDKK